MMVNQAQVCHIICRIIFQPMDTLKSHPQTPAAQTWPRFLAKHSYRRILYGLGTLAALTTAYLLYGFYTGRMHKDIKRVERLASIIDNSFEEAEGALLQLVIERRVAVKKQEITMVYSLMSKLKDKERNRTESIRNPFLPPFEKGLFITELEPNHRLLYNKFNIYKNHLLVVTKEFESQLQRLSRQDFKQVILSARALNGAFFFNCGPQSGASQPHKHIQILPEEITTLPLFSAIDNYIRTDPIQDKSSLKSSKWVMLRYPDFHFLHGIYKLDPVQDLSQMARQVSHAQNLLYIKLIGSDASISYNVVGCDRFLMMIPRKKEKAFGELSINSVGMIWVIAAFMGSILFKDEAFMSKYLSLEIQPESILEDITFGL